MWEHKDFLILFAAGNDGSDGNRDGVVDEGSLTPPGTAKNCITVGAAESVRAPGWLPAALRAALAVRLSDQPAEKRYSFGQRGRPRRLQQPRPDARRADQARPDRARH